MALSKNSSCKLSANETRKELKTIKKNKKTSSGRKSLKRSCTGGKWGSCRRLVSATQLFKAGAGYFGLPVEKADAAVAGVMNSAPQTNTSILWRARSGVEREGREECGAGEWLSLWELCWLEQTG